ncbi:MAG TPA: glycosyltransferase family 2 protein [Steroidobacteraceae bacterium]
MQVSVIVSTRDRAADLARLLQSLSRCQVGPGREWELVLVDNGSSDDTPRVIEEFARTSPFRIVALREPRSGKSNALNTALAHARGAILAFTDDDVIVTPDWIERIIDTFGQRPDLACAGGMVRLFNPEDAAISIRLATEEQTVDLSNFSADCIPVMGCNMAVRADVCRQLGMFDPLLGPGCPIPAAEDLDFLYRLVRAGYRIGYVPSITVLHNHGRRTAQQLDRLRANYLMGRGAFYAKQILARDRLVMRWARWECVPLLGWHWLGAFVSARSRRCLGALGWITRGAWRYLTCSMRQTAGRTA